MSNNKLPPDINNILSQFPPEIQNQFKNSGGPVKELNVLPDRNSKPQSGKAPPQSSFLPAGSDAEQSKILSDLSSMAEGITFDPENTRQADPQEELVVNSPMRDVSSLMESSSREVKVIKTHPLLESIKRKLGVSQSLDIKVIEYNDIKWGITKVDTRDGTLISELINKDTSIENIATMQLDDFYKAATVSIALRTVDDIPLYEVMGLDTKDFVIKDKLNPPRALKKEAASKFISILLSATDNSGTLEYLYSKYESFSGSDSNLSESNVSSWVCPTCGRTIKEVIQYDSDNREKLFYCMYDASVMDRLEVVKENELPLSLS